MKNLIKTLLSLVLLVSTLAINAFEGVSTITQTTAVTRVAQNILLDNDQQSFIAPFDGTYSVSFNANLFNMTPRPTAVAIQAYVNNFRSTTVFATGVVPGGQPLSISFHGKLQLNENDVVNFRWETFGPSLFLQPTNGAPSFKVTINPEKPSIKL